MRIDVSDISGDFEQMYVYLSRGGALTPITAVHDRDTDEIVFKTNYLGTFIISEDEVALSTEEPAEPTDPDDPNYVPPAPTNPVNPNPTNPGTGASHAADLITAIGLAAITGAGSLLRKRK
jgi:LPXTG-motif cell wall-anchored protein